MSAATEEADAKSKPTQIKVEFGGGLELLFGNERKHEVSIPEDAKNANIRWLIGWLKDNKLKERPELFVESGTVSILIYKSL
jgi:ubiquitin related modifier 1